MASFYDDDNARSSDNDEDEEMEDLEGGEGDGPGDMEVDAQNDDDNQDNLDDEDPDEPPDLDDSPSRPMSQRRHSSNYVNGGEERDDRRRSPAQSGQGRTPQSRRASEQPEPQPFRPLLRPEAVTATTYDIAPTIAAPHATSINAITATPDMRWVFTGGSDGWVRKFYWVDTVNGKSMLTVAQKHPFVESVQKAGVLNGYWENEDIGHKASSMQYTDDGPAQSAVYSLAVQHQALWLCSGTESGAINLNAVRHEEGKRITSLHKHTSAVSVMVLSQDETSLLSGSWDKIIHDWDLNTGQVKRSFTGSGGQISAIEMRPVSDVAVPRDFAENRQPNDDFAGDSANRKRSRGSLSNGAHDGSRRQSQAGVPSTPGSLFGDNDSLFAENDNTANGLGFEQDDENEFSKAFAGGVEQLPNLDGSGTQHIEDQENIMNDHLDLGGDEEVDASGILGRSTYAGDTGLPQSEKTEAAPTTSSDVSPAELLASESTFLDAAIDGTLRIWDRRQPNPVARIIPGRGTPPWCMHACWSHDGNFIYAGRRNGTVDEYSLRHGLKEPRRTLNFPAGSGPVSAVRAMPNSTHLVCASYDILRLYDLKDEENAKKSTVPFLIVPGHRTGVVSQLYLDTTCSYLISTGGNRGWEGSSTEVLLGYEIGLGH